MFRRALLVCCFLFSASFLFADCASPVNAIVRENCQPGNPASEWDVSTGDAGSSSIQGYATDISVNAGATVHFKVDTAASSYRLDIYRMGYYGGSGARKVASVTPSATLPQTQPPCARDSATGLIDCGTWAESAHWDVPAAAASGIYFAHLVRTDGTAGDSHIVFVVRNDASHSDLLFQTSDTTWQAYNQYGGNSLYVGQPAGRAYKVSYNRPITTRSTSAEDFVFNAEYPMVRWLEANGYDVTYMTGLDSDRNGALLKNHKVFMSVGHDEYWSAGQRNAAEAARDAGVHLAFFSGNESFWKTRWEPSIDGSNTAYRTLVSYKETHAQAKIDPTNIWTGSWRDPLGKPYDGDHPENAMSGNIFMVNCCSTAISVPAADGKMRLWRNTSVASLASGATATLPDGTLGYEWDEDLDNGSRPAGLIHMSTTTTNEPQVLLDQGSNYGPGTATHHLTLYKKGNALVFGAGTMQWSWGLDSNHDRGNAAADARMQQATVNLFADMGVQPSSLQSGLTAATASADTTAPTSAISSPVNGANVNTGATVTVTGTAADAGGGVVGGVDVSADGGTTWHPADGRENWAYNWTVPVGQTSATLMSRATDDSGNIQSAITSISVNLTTNTSGAGCVAATPCHIWGDSFTPSNIVTDDASAYELGTRFQASADGYITGVRFYRTGAVDGDTASLWQADGTLLATASFANKTASGWQEATFDSPVAVQAGTTYIASYFKPSGAAYAASNGFFTSSAAANPPLTAVQSTASAPNGVFNASASAFPTSSYQDSSYFVDVSFVSSGGGSTGSAPVLSNVAVKNLTATGATITWTTDTASDSRVAYGTTSAYGSNAADPNQTTTHSVALSGLTAGTAYHFQASSTNGGGQTGTVPDATFTTTSGTIPACPCSMFGTTTPASLGDIVDTDAYDLGVKFRSDVDGYITGIRFYKTSSNNGTHTGSLWSSAGTRLATATFTNESASGWQDVQFSQPVAVTAGTTYIASYFTSGAGYAYTWNYFDANPAFTGPVRGLAAGVSGANGVFAAGGGFPTADNTKSTNYWVDVDFTTTVGPDTTPPTIATVLPANNATGVATNYRPVASFSEALDSTTINGNTFMLTSAGTAVPASVTYDAATNKATLTPSSPLATSTTFTATLKSGANGVKDRAGNALASDYTWTFTTGSTTLLPPTEGPGGPILVISSSSNAFSTYFAEILRAEGLNEFKRLDISQLDAATLANYDVAILGDFAIGDAQVSMLSDWVNAGGKLIAMHPGANLLPLLGLTATGNTISNGYVQMSTTAAPSKGIESQSMQFHGDANVYSLNGATTIANLASDVAMTTTVPGITTNTVGSGTAIAFAYDLARSIVYTRQGNPAWVGDSRDGQIPPIRSDNLFFGNKAGDPQPDWVNLDKVQIPQADEQQRLLANLMLTSAKKPLPRFWYFPGQTKAVVILTGDDHGNGGTAGRFDSFIAASPANCSVDDWQCVRGTSYIYTSTPLSDADAKAFVDQGFEIGLHTTTNCADFTPSSLESDFATQLADWQAKYSDLPAPVTNRTHCIPWSDWATHPKVELNHGIRLDANYYYWPDVWIQDRPGMFTGSGMPMRFADSDGQMIDVYQATTQMTDESGQTFPKNINTLLDNAVGTKGYYGAFTANMHTDNAQSDGATAIVNSAQARGVPIVSSKQMLTWLDGRNSSAFSGESWNNNALSFTVAVATGANRISAMLPTSIANGALTGITYNGTNVSFTAQTVKGVEYAFFAALPGNYVAQYSNTGSGSNTAPVAADQSVTTTAGSAKTIVLSATDADSNPLTYSVVTSPSHGQLTGTAPNLTFTPAANYTGADSFTFKANDGTADSNVATVSISVTAATATTTTTTLSATPNPATVGASVTLTATVGANGGTPTGSVTFTNVTTTLGTQALNASGVASIAVTTLPEGTDTITATYAGDSTYQGSSGTFAEKVNAATATCNAPTSAGVNICAPGAAATVSSPVQILAAAAPATAGKPVTGMKAYIDDKEVASGNNNVLTGSSAQAPGTHSLIINAWDSTGALVQAKSSFTVGTTTGSSATTSGVTASPNPATYGQAVTLTASVTGSASPTGSVTFMAGGATLGSATLTSGTASLQVSTLPVGTLQITAAYSGDATNAPSTSAAYALTVTQAASLSSMSSTPNPSTAGQAVTFNVTVSGTGAVPTGSVTFTAGSTTLGSQALNAAGQAALSTAALAAGSVTVTATYSGDANYNPSATSVTQTVNASTGGGGSCVASSVGVTICAPASGAVDSPVTITAAAKGNKPITAMKVYVSGIQVASSSSGTVAASVAASAGSHQLVVNAWDAAGTLYQSKQSFTVGSGSGGGSSCGAPTSAGLNVCSPTNGASASSPVSITAYANGGGKPITAIVAYIDGRQVTSSRSATLNGSVAVAAGTHTLNVNAWNSAGKLYTYQGTFVVH